MFFRSLGNDWDVSPSIARDLEEFTCILYGKARQKSVNAVRSVILKEMVGEDEKLTMKFMVDLSRLPPCQSSLQPHIDRVNHRLAIYKRADQPIFWTPKPYDQGQGWTKNQDGTVEPVWSYGPILPPSLIDLIQKTAQELDDVDEINEIDYDITLNDSDDE